MSTLWRDIEKLKYDVIIDRCFYTNYMRLNPSNSVFLEYVQKSLH